MSSPASEKGYPRDLEARRTTRSGLEVFLRPIKPEDLPRYQAFLQSLSSESIYLKFFRLVRATEDFVAKMMEVDYVRQMVILAFESGGSEEKILGMARYNLNEDESTAEVYFGVRDEYQNHGLGRELLSHLIWVARRRGLKGLSAQVMADNRRMLRLFRSFEGKEYKIQRRLEAGIFFFDMEFLQKDAGSRMQDA